MSSQLDGRQQIRYVMNQIADETGGEAFYGNNDVAGLLRRGFEDSENYYTLAYSPKDRNWDGKYRKLSVTVARGGYSLSYRKGYYALSEQAPANTAVAFQRAMRIENPPATMLSLSTAAAASGGALHLKSVLDLRGVTLTPQSDGKQHAELFVGVMAYPYGVPEKAATATQMSATLRLNLTPEQHATLLKEGVVFPQELPLKPGKYVLRLGVLDRTSGRIGTLTLPFTMP